MPGSVTAGHVRPVDAVVRPVYRLARRVGLRRRLIHLTRYGHPLNPFNNAGWDPDRREFR